MIHAGYADQAFNQELVFLVVLDVHAQAQLHKVQDIVHLQYAFSQDQHVVHGLLDKWSIPHFNAFKLPDKNLIY
jgi:hypothetical protein